MTLDTHYKQLLESLNTAVVVLNPDLTINYLNPTAESLLAVSGSRMLGVEFGALFSDSQATCTRMRKAMASGNPFTRRRATWHLHSNREITIDFTVTPLSSPTGIAVEIQPLDRLLKISKEEATLSAHETTRNLVRGLAHEIKNPLGGIRGAAQLLERTLNNPEQEEFTKVIIEESDRLRNLVDNMLGPRQLPKMAELNVHEVLERTARLIEAESEGKIVLDRDYDPSIPDITADREMLIQAMLNIGRNAMQALLESNTSAAKITLRSRISRQFSIGRETFPLVCRLEIEDNGPGIPEKIADNIFFPMISGRPSGSGLGLSISQQLISQHNGLIKCDSSPGCTLFTVYLPME
jgi:two-component system nitrogen regulation sensor histidine kinase GlnL